MAQINMTNSLLAGAQAAISETWRKEFPIYKEMQDAFLFPLPYTNIRKAPYVFKDRIPMPKPWPYGKGRIHQGFKDRKIEISILPYELTMSWDERNEADDQLKDVKTHASQGTERFFQIPDILIGEYMSGTGVYNYGGLANAYDGVGLYSTVDGDGAARYGVTGGNILTGQGVTTTAKVQADIIQCRQRFLQMLEPVVGQPLHNPRNVMYNKMHFVIPPQLDGVFSKLQELELIYADPSLAVATSNLVKGKIKYTVNQRLSDANDWFVVLSDTYWKPFAYRAPQTLRQLFSTFENSDLARETAQVSVFCDLRIGIGPWCPWTTMKVSNS